MKDDLTPATKRDIRESEARVLRHFDAALEAIRHDLLGVNRDELEVMKDRQANHEQRITTLERSTGLVTN